MQAFWPSNFRKSTYPPTTRPGGLSITSVGTCRVLWHCTILTLSWRNPPSPARMSSSNLPFTTVSSGANLWCHSMLTLLRRGLRTVDSTLCASNYRCCRCWSTLCWCRVVCRECSCSRCVCPLKLILICLFWYFSRPVNSVIVWLWWSARGVRVQA